MHQRSAEELAAQKSRNRWLALALVAFVVLVGATTIIRLGASVGEDCSRFYMGGGVKDIQEQERCEKQKALREAQGGGLNE